MSQDLWTAARNGKIEDIKKCLKEDALDVNVKSSNDGLTALHYACRYGTRDIVELLLDHGADIEASSYHPYHTPLMLACSSTTYDRYSITKFLLDRGAKMTRPFYGDHGPLHKACTSGHASIVKLLLDRGCAVNSVSINGDTPLHKACSNQRRHCIEELLFHGADTTIKNQNGKTPLDLVAYQDTRSLIRHITMERKKSPEQYLKNNSSVHDRKSSEMSNTLKAEDAECAESTLERRLSSKIKTIIDCRCEELKNDMLATSKQDTNQTVVNKLTSDLEAEVGSIIDRRCEELQNDMLASQREEMNKNVETINQESSNQIKANQSIETLITLPIIVANDEEAATWFSTYLASKVSSIEVHCDSNEESSIESQHRCEELCNTIVGNQEEMNKSDSKDQNDTFDAERKAGEGEFEIIYAF